MRPVSALGRRVTVLPSTSRFVPMEPSTSSLQNMEVNLCIICYHRYHHNQHHGTLDHTTIAISMLSEFLFIPLVIKRMFACCDMFNSFLRRRCFSLSTFPSCYATVISRRFSYGHASNDGTRRTNDKGRKIQKSLRVMKTSGTMQEQEHEQLSMGGNTGEGEVEEKVDCLLPQSLP